MHPHQGKTRARFETALTFEYKYKDKDKDKDTPAIQRDQKPHGHHLTPSYETQLDQLKDKYKYINTHMDTNLDRSGAAWDVVA